ncbi:hypothetical protein V491_09167 [Pseudogymnoascus sp. VKM F-3775]|nr:hypothetical protein V491_09167 [Pseudogymnoascus sp. VKM F-3775]
MVTSSGLLGFLCGRNDYQATSIAASSKLLGLTYGKNDYQAFPVAASSEPSNYIYRKEGPITKQVPIADCFAEALSGENQLHSPHLTNRSREALAITRPKKHTELDLRLSKIRHLGAVEDIFDKNELTAAEGVTGDRSYERFRSDQGSMNFSV